MKIELRIADADLGTVQNVMFKPKKQFKMTLLPLPPEEWVGKQVCSVCGGEPKFLQESMQPICQKCIHQIMSGLNKKESNAETSIPITMEIVLHSRFEWSVDGEKWYSLMEETLKLTVQKYS